LNIQGGGTIVGNKDNIWLCTKSKLNFAGHQLHNYVFSAMQKHLVWTLYACSYHKGKFTYHFGILKVLWNTTKLTVCFDGLCEAVCAFLGFSECYIASQDCCLATIVMSVWIRSRAQTNKYLIFFLSGLVAKFKMTCLNMLCIQN
jgi:hypothetical protein